MNIRICVVLSTLLIGACAGRAVQSPPATEAEIPEAEAVAAPAAPAQPKVSAEQLVGQSAGWLGERLGEPGFTRRDGEAEIWQYKSSVCVVNIFLYPAHEGAGEYSAQYFETRDLKGASTKQEACLNSL